MSPLDGWRWQVWLRRRSQHRRPASGANGAPVQGEVPGPLLRAHRRATPGEQTQNLQVAAAPHIAWIPPGFAGILSWLVRLVLERLSLVSSIAREMLRRLLAQIRTLRQVVPFPAWADIASVRPWLGENRFHRDQGVANGQPVEMSRGNPGPTQAASHPLAAAALCHPHRLQVATPEGSRRARLSTHGARPGRLQATAGGPPPTRQHRGFPTVADRLGIPQPSAAAEAPAAPSGGRA